MMITENGIATKDEAKHIRYMREHLGAVRDMMAKGYDVRGYFVWSLADNYEWHYGYVPKFGLCTMDPQTRDRVPKPSAGFYRDVIRASQAAGRVVPDPSR
jgi:beta-glucosidase